VTRNDTPIRLERPERGIAVLTLCRGNGPNVISAELCERLLSCAETLNDSDTLHAVLLRAEGPAFCVGADLRQMHERLDDLLDYTAALIDAAHAAVLALNRLPVPVIACVHGVAAGGGFSLALGCDRMMAARSARFVVAYPQLGTTPDTGLSHSLAALLGSRRALELCLSPTPLSADDAHRLGVVSEVVDDPDLDAAGLAAARQLVALPRTAVVGAKALFTADASRALEMQLRLEKEWFLRCAATAEFRNRVLDFCERPAGAKPQGDGV
jgi:2-(1,2-epoxy-1,2-dihydrophenyl)acetyl-CoA isomerase